MKQITQKYIKEYLIETYGTIKHEPKFLKIAANETAKYLNNPEVEIEDEYSDINVYNPNKNIKPEDVFHFIVDDDNTISGTFSYGFHTRYGREIKDIFSELYNEAAE